ncbi:MAG: IS3 family transposase [Acidobacteria bacterium]|nr:IS3 family transposase [Acidobacteriota bacterium]
MTTMKRHRHTPEQAVRKLREGERLLNEGKDLTEVLRHLEIAESTWNRWRHQYGGMNVSGAKRLKELEAENARLKRLLAEAELDKAMLKELGRGKMVTPDRRRRAVVVLQGRFGVSERRACRVVGQWRSTQRRPARPMPTEDEKLRRRLRDFAHRHPRLGWRKAHDVVRREGWVVNHKRLRRLWREEGLRRPLSHKNKKRRPGTSDGTLLRAEHPNHVWALDFQFDETADLRRLKLLNIVDEHTREALAMDVDRSITADQVVGCIERLVAARGAPRHLRMDNGPELIAWALRDWCRLAGLDTIYIEPGSPWENPWIESFNGRARDELLNITEFGSLTEARIVIEDWRIEYNTWRPHSSLGGLTPAEYAAQWTRNNQPKLP